MDILKDLHNVVFSVPAILENKIFKSVEENLLIMNIMEKDFFSKLSKEMQGKSFKLYCKNEKSLNILLDAIYADSDILVKSHYLLLKSLEISGTIIVLGSAEFPLILFRISGERIIIVLENIFMKGGEKV